MWKKKGSVYRELFGNFNKTDFYFSSHFGYVTFINAIHFYSIF